MKKFFKKIRDGIDKIMVKFGNFGGMDNMMSYSSTHWQNPENIQEWHMGWLITHPIKWVKGLIHNHISAFILIALVIVLSLLYFSGIIDEGGVMGIAVIVGIAWVIYGASRQ